MDEMRQRKEKLSSKMKQIKIEAKENAVRKDEFLEFSNKNGVMTRPIWRLMNELDMYRNCQKTNLENAKFLEQRVVNISSSVIL